jgi:hypothetical protein
MERGSGRLTRLTGGTLAERRRQLVVVADETE